MLRCPAAWRLATPPLSARLIAHTGASAKTNIALIAVVAATLATGSNGGRLVPKGRLLKPGVPASAGWV
jgi:hypothetical protein